MKPTWIVIADGSRARLFEQMQPAGPWRELRAWVNPASRLRTESLAFDQLGRASKGHPGATSYVPRTTPRQREHRRFAHELARHLEGSVQRVEGRDFAPEEQGTVQSNRILDAIGREDADHVTLTQAAGGEPRRNALDHRLEFTVPNHLARWPIDQSGMVTELAALSNEVLRNGDGGYGRHGNRRPVRGQQTGRASPVACCRNAALEPTHDH
jgi:hypothetical protein